MTFVLGLAIGGVVTAVLGTCLLAWWLSGMFRF